MSQEKETNMMKDVVINIPKKTSDKNLMKQNFESQLHNNGIDMDYIHLSEIEFKVKEKDTSASIGPIGLMGFGLTTFMLNLKNAKVFEFDSVILGMGTAYGGLAQLLAGLLEWKKGNNFTAVAFMSYGSFWFSFVLLEVLSIWNSSLKPSNMSLAFYLFIWFVFTCVMTGASFTKPWAVRLIFIFLSLLFLFLAAGDWSQNDKVTQTAGVIGIICALIAMYTGAAEILNDAWKRTLFPLGAPGEQWLGKIV